MERLIYFLVATVMMLMVVEGQFDPTSRPVEVFVNVYNHPKTGFSCQGKNPGEYYADPATKCAVYYVCIPNPAGSMSAQSFACPNGTIFSQATRVCRPHEEVFCPLAPRYYNSVQGSIDSPAGPHDILMPGSLPVPPAGFADSPPAPAPPSNKPTRAAQPQPQRQQQPQPPKPAPVPVNQFQGRYRSRGQQQQQQQQQTSTTTTTTTTPAPPPPEIGGPGDYEYDYADYINDTSNPALANGLIHAGSAPQPILDNQNDNGNDQSSTTSETGANRRRKRESSQWKIMAPADSTTDHESFTCRDKISGIPYADQQSQCQRFYVCVMISKGKLIPYRFDCESGQRFDQKRGICTEMKNITVRQCEKSHQYYIRNKWFGPSKKHLLATMNKM